MKKDRPDVEDYKSFFEETPVALIRTDIRSGEFLMANKCAAEMFGFATVEDLMANAKTVNLYPPEDRKKLLQKLRRNGFVYDYEIQIKTPHGSIWISARLRLSCEGKCIEGSLIDITELVSLRNSQLTYLQEIGRNIDKKIADFSKETITQ